MEGRFHAVWASLGLSGALEPDKWHCIVAPRRAKVNLWVENSSE